ncbi:GH39 family glycosyl hydrolase [Parasporobacterium paucivorans]|uniref:Beta-xylosidase n=1 Tax=Parasporobacterium paucivorans DSM 15970 TaxID=1122934 RepID=A0A1M6FCF5_9FIRM|nr:helix-turn-helix domain-containing protein [Parasporobacterium paucivorans]SHI95299.1 Beta-xylosidase [Parasporobacterium paucivorans DSM 15970]
MDAKQISFDFGKEVPIQFSIVTTAPLGRHWHPQIEIVYVLEGESEIIMNEQKYLLKEDQLLVINPYRIHTIQNDKCTMGVFLINLSMFDQTLVRESLQIDCNSITIGNDDQLLPLKHLLARIVKSNISIEKPKHAELLNKSLAYALLFELISKFSVKEVSGTIETSATFNRMEDIIKYINLHYAENISLKELSRDFFLSVPYLSRIFKKYIGMNFTEYLNSVRLARSVEFLRDSEITTENISQLCGFPNSRSFVNTFRKEYGETPAQYRRNIKLQKPDSPRPLVPSQHNQLYVLAKYLHNEELGSSDVQYYFPDLAEIAPVDVTQKGFPLKHTYRRMIGIGKAKHLLYQESRNILTCVQKELGFSYITFYGLLDDDMMVFSRDGSHNPHYNFQYIDAAFDFLVSIGLKPFIQLSFMPKDLAETSDRTMFYNPSIISLPNALSDWYELVRRLTQHLLSRYGEEEVTTWPFSVWNEPETSESLYGFEDQNAFFRFYKETFHSVKGCCAGISFGTPSFICETLEQMDWFRDYMKYCQDNSCIPEFLNYHFFPLKLNDKIVERNFVASSALKYRESPDSLKESIYSILKNLKDGSFLFDRIFMTQWNSSVSHRELINDTAFKSAYIVKNILENYDRLDSFSYWMLSDFNDELQVPEQAYHGGLGLITANGVRKASYYAFVLLSRLGSTLIGKGNGYFITRNGGSFQIILYNYQHFSKLYAEGELFDLTFTSRYAPFTNESYKKMVLPLEGLDDRKYQIRETILNRKYGSSFDNWVNAGALPFETPEEADYINGISRPHVQRRIIQVSGNYHTFSCELEPHEVRLIEMAPSLD